MSQADGRKCRPRGVFVNHLRNPQKQKPLFQRFCIFHPPWNTKKHLMFRVSGPTILNCIEQTDVVETWMMWPWQLNTLSMLFMLKLGRMIKQNLGQYWEAGIYILKLKVGCDFDSDDFISYLLVDEIWEFHKDRDLC